MFLSVNTQINFKAKNKKIRKASDIARKAKLEYPVLSTTYANAYYHIDNSKIVKKLDILCKKIIDSREEFLSKIYKKQLKFDSTSENLRKILSVIKKTKVGNCEELAIAVYAALCANGYTNSEKVGLYYETKLVDKLTKEVLASAKTDLDHSVVMTSMSQNPNDKKDVVIDNWLGFAESPSGAIGKFKEVYTDNALKKARDKNIKTLNIKYGCLEKDCEYRSNIVFVVDREHFPLRFAEPKEAEHMKASYSNLVIHNCDKQ